MKIQILTGAIAICFASAARAQTTDSPPADPNANVPPGTVTVPDHAKPADPDVPRDPSAPVGSAANPVQVGGNMTPPPPPRKDYPVCGGAVQDQCINPRAARGNPR